MPKAESQEEVARKVAAEMLPGVSVELLKELHLLTREGRLNADSRRKLKQVAHFLGFLRAPLEDVTARHEEPVIVDCAAGKAYLSLLLAQALLPPWPRAKLFAVENRPELARGTAERATRLGIGGLHAVHAEIADATLPARIHLVTALHACDTATDDALALAIRHQSDHVLVVPCCQAEVARQLGEHAPPDAAIASLASHAWHRRELGSHLTNVIRVLALEAHGYKVTVTELAGWEHSLKNELIVGKRVQRHDARAAGELACPQRTAARSGLRATARTRSSRRTTVCSVDSSIDARLPPTASTRPSWTGYFPPATHNRAVLGIVAR